MKPYGITFTLQCSTITALCQTIKNVQESLKQIADALFSRSVKHILLLQVNELNADNFDAIVKIFKDRGYQFVSFEEALRDSIYQKPYRYVPTFD